MLSAASHLPTKFDPTGNLLRADPSDVQGRLLETLPRSDRGWSFSAPPGKSRHGATSQVARRVAAAKRRVWRPYQFRWSLRPTATGPRLLARAYSSRCLIRPQ